MARRAGECPSHRQCAAEFNPLLQPVWQAPHRRSADRLDFKEVDHFFHMSAVFQFFLLGRAEIQALPEEITVHFKQSAGHQIVQRTHAAKQGDVLEGPGNAVRCGVVRVHRREGFPLRIGSA